MVSTHFSLRLKGELRERNNKVYIMNHVIALHMLRAGEVWRRSIRAVVIETTLLEFDISNFLWKLWKRRVDRLLLSL